MIATSEAPTTIDAPTGWQLELLELVKEHGLRECQGVLSRCAWEEVVNRPDW